jgi:cystathionine gamma-synthase
MMGSLESWLLLRSLRTLHLRVPRQSASATELAQWLNSVSKTPIGKTYDGIPGGTISQVWHSALQGPDERGFDPKTQMQGGWNATFAFLVRDSTSTAYYYPLIQLIARETGARVCFPSTSSILHCKRYVLYLQSLFTLFQSQPATSLGGVESLIDHRIKSDPSADPRLIRLSIGVEDVEVSWPHPNHYSPTYLFPQDLRLDLRQALQRLHSVGVSLSYGHMTFTQSLA